MIEFNGTYKAVFWIKVSKDGSIYLSPRIINPKKIIKGKSKSIGGNLSVKYEDGTEISDIDKHKGGKISFHASGIINSLGERSYINSLRGITEQRYLCSILFQWLERFEGIETSKLKNRDICLRFPIDSSQPIITDIFVSPLEKTQILNNSADPNLKNQVNIVLLYRGLIDMPDIAIQIVLKSGKFGEWPKYSTVVYPTNENNVEVE